MGTEALQQSVMVEIKASNIIMKQGCTLQVCVYLYAFNMQCTVDCIKDNVWGITEGFKQENK